MDSVAYFKKWQRLYIDNLKKLFWEDDYIISKLEILIKAIEKSKRAFIENGSFAFCARCAQSGEKCCQAGLEWKLRPSEYLLNLVLADYLKTEIKFNLERPEDCLFLGEKGCNLILTPIFCRNFFCDKLSNFLGHKRLINIQQAMEEEATLSFLITEHINKKYLLKIN